MWLLLSKKVSKNISFNKKYTYLIDLKKINILVGKNNSGKSYLMREILRNTIKVINRDEIKNFISECKFNDHFDKLKSLVCIDELKDINNKYLNILSQMESFDKAKKDNNSFNMLSGREIYSFENYDHLVTSSTELLKYLGYDRSVNSSIISDEVIHNYSSLLNKVVTEYKLAVKDRFYSISDSSIYKFGDFLYEFGFVKSKYNEYMNNYNPNNEGVIPYTFKNYIPLFRSIRHPLKNPKEKDNSITDIYKTRIIKEYNYNENEINIITGLDFYFEYKKKLLGSKNDRELVNKFETFLSNYFFEGKNISIIPDEETYELKINIDGSDDRFIYEVGDGVTSLIIIMFHIFLYSNRENNIYFIEEPEQSFHPGFQRLFINMISMNDIFGNCYFFFTTHSNHLIDISNHEFKDFNNFLCTKNNDSIIVKVLNDNDIEIMNELGVTPSSVQIANKIIWVEGKYDAFYIRLLLNKKNININDRKYIEDYDYVYVPYGGSNGTLINFSLENDDSVNNEFIMKAKSINNNFLIIMDDDEISTGKSKRKKEKRYYKLKDELGDSLYKLNVREIENLFPVEVIKNFFINNIAKKDIDFSFLDNINYEDYKDIRLGPYLNKLVKENIGDDLKNITGREDGFEVKGFLYSKSKFYDSVLGWIMNDSFDYEKDVTYEAKDLINTIEDFIKC